MPIVAGVNRISLVGTGPSGEIFDTSFWVLGPVVSSQAQATAVAEAIRDLFTAGPQAVLLGLIYSDYSYAEVRAYCYPTGGPTATYIGAATITGGAGTATSPTQPLQTAMVCSLRTGAAGRRNRGRMYLPASGAPVGTHQFSSTLVTNVANAMAAFFTAINADAIASTVTVVSQVAPGHQTLVNEVIVDSKPDIQRRRAGKLTPLFTIHASV